MEMSGKGSSSSVSTDVFSGSPSVFIDEAGSMGWVSMVMRREGVVL